MCHDFLPEDGTKINCIWLPCIGAQAELRPARGNEVEYLKLRYETTLTNECSPGLKLGSEFFNKNKQLSVRIPSPAAVHG